MIIDLDVLAALSNRDSYERYSRFVKQTSLGEESWNIFSAMGEWLKNNPKADSIKWDAFGAWFTLVRHAKMAKEKLKVHKDLIAMMATKELDEQSLAPLIHGLAKRDFAGRIGDLALRISDGEQGDFDQIHALITEYDLATGRLNRIDDSVQKFSLEDMESASAPGLHWRLNCLWEGFGDLRQGDLVVFGKRPNVGGTTFLASEATYMAEQMPDEQQVLWVNNEERGSKVRSRIVQACLQWPTQKLFSEKKAAMNEFFARMGRPDKFIVYDNATAHVKDVDELLKRHNIGLIVVDQGWKMKGFEKETETMRQTLIANWLREVSKQYAPTIAVYQADAYAEGQRWINQSQLYYSKTGVQGEADLIITMGRDFTTGNTRYIWLPKNKSQTPGNPAKREGKWEVTIVADEARFQEYTK